MSTIITVLAHTPPWAFVVIVLVLVLAARNFRTRTISAGSLFIFPAILVLLAVINVVHSPLGPLAAGGRLMQNMLQAPDFREAMAARRDQRPPAFEPLPPEPVWWPLGDPAA